MQEEGIPFKQPSRFKQFFIDHKKAILIISPIVLLLIISGLVWFVAGSKSTTSKDQSPTTTETTPEPTTVDNLLTGVSMDKDSAQKPMVAVMIENLYPDARPQSGLSQAGVVYEAIAEGGITRFMGIFQEPFPTIIGPVRSVRPYYADWASEYNIALAHAGGSQDGLAKVQASGYKNIEALVQSSGFYRSTDRAAPHNLYSKTDLLANLLTKLKFDTVPSFTPLPRKADTPETTPSHPKIVITFSTTRYTVQYDFDAASDSYKRSQGGAAQIDRNTNQQISVKNVVVEFMPTSYGTQGNGKPETNINLIGTGKALFFIDGGYKEGKWTKSSDKAQTTFADLDGKPIQFNRGNTWFSVIPNGNSVTF